MTPRSYTGKQICRLLEQNDWVLWRIRGSHHIYSKAGVRFIITVPVHGSKQLKQGLCRSILKMADLAE